MTKIKICGITNIEDAIVAAEAGADFLGFIFHPASPRYVSVDAVHAITEALWTRFDIRAPRCVGVFVDVPTADVRTAVAQAGLDLAQLHGSESPEAIAALQPCAFKAIRPRTHDEAAMAYHTYVDAAMPRRPDRPQLLVDAYHPQAAGGTGTRADVTVARWLSERCRIMLAGGLTPENVADAIARVQPWGVDVSSGVEASKGRKDHQKIRAFIQAVRPSTAAVRSPTAVAGAGTADHGVNL